MFLTRVELSASAVETDAFWREVSRPYGAHQALWTLFGRAAEQRRDFLFRQEESARRPSFLVLSAARPEERDGGPWRVNTKPFEPKLSPGQRLAFKLRASPVVRKGERVEGKRNRRVHRHDVVMERARSLEAAGKPLPSAAALAHGAGLDWLERQAGKAGFRIVETDVERVGDDGLLEAERRPALRVDGYRQHRIVRRGEVPIRFSTLDFEGQLEVVDPRLFLEKVKAGFGPQKAFGCGLMLLRRA